MNLVTWYWVGVGADVSLLVLLGWLRLKSSPAVEVFRPLLLKTALAWAVSLLLACAFLFLLTPVAYLFAYNDFAKGGKAAIECATFALPCLAGIVVGFALIRHNSDDFRKDPNARYYVGSAVVLMLSYVAYVGSHFRPMVLTCIGLAVVLPSAVGLLILFWHRTSNKHRSRLYQRKIAINADAQAANGLAQALMVLLLTFVILEVVGIAATVVSNFDSVINQADQDEKCCKCD